jgi:DNA-binding MarR family transcriptional regulator
MKQGTRRRSACLAALERMRTWRKDIPLNDVVAFLYVCENEGVTLRELAAMTRLDQSTASRAIARLASRRDPASGATMPLVHACERDDDGRAWALLLTDTGASLRNDIDAIIARADPIVMRT